MKTPFVRLLAIALGLAFWALNATFANHVWQHVDLVQAFFLYPFLVTVCIFSAEFLRVRHLDSEPEFHWPNWASFVFILVPVVAGAGGLLWTFMQPTGSTNIMMYALAAIIGVQLAHLANEI